MASAKKKAKQVDPISERARTLNDQIASLESEIKKLDTQLQRTTAPKFRSTAIPHGETVLRKSEPAPEPVFEEINKKPLQLNAETETSDRYNDLGVRKYDLPSMWNRLRDQFRRPTTSNPRLVNYLAAGGVHGLRPLRYEKRVARNRLIVLIIVLAVVLLGIFSVILHNR